MLVGIVIFDTFIIPPKHPKAFKSLPQFILSYSHQFTKWVKRTIVSSMVTPTVPAPNGLNIPYSLPSKPDQPQHPMG